MHDHPHVARHINTIADHGVTVRVWLEPDPTMRAVIVHLDEYGQELHLPFEVARRVADAIARAAASDPAWCVPARCVA